MSCDRKAYRLNVEGDFYVVDGCCTLCGVPGITAPELFGGFNPDGTVPPDVDHCWVKRQPRSDAELNAMVETMARQELQCIRYRGTDSRIVDRLRDIGEGDQVD
jgi:hypothetical protein